MLGRQRLHAANAGDHFIVKLVFAALLYGAKNSYRAVVQGRVAPYEERATFAILHLVCNQTLENELLVAVQIVNGSDVIPSFRLRSGLDA